MREIALLGVLALVLGGCAGMIQRPADSATAELKTAQGQAVGAAVLTEVTGGVRIVVEVRGLPAGEKGVHIHDVGKCEAPDFTSAGEHFNPHRRQHGLQNPAGPHAGDLPNITIDANGTGRLETVTDRVLLGSGATSLFDGDGSALVVHGAPDDHRTDPSGNSGARVVCGVIVKK